MSGIETALESASVQRQFPYLPQVASTADWLLTGPAQLRSGPHAGAIAGTLSLDGRAAYVYPEIAGYYLQWLAWRSRRYGGASALRTHAGAVQTWLKVWLAAGSPPPTRIHLDAGADDWRNDAVFCFDVAMVLRGLASAANAGLLVADEAVVRGVADQLRRLTGSDGTFAACLANSPARPLPQRWSTRKGGAFLSKAAAGVITAAQTLSGIPAAVIASAHATFVTSLDALVAEPHREAHPLLYAFEGVMALPDHPRFAASLKVVAVQFAALLDHARERGYVPETLGAGGAGGPLRVDVQAQALRIGDLLALHRPDAPPDMIALIRLRHALTRQVQESGAVTFTVDTEPASWNVWATMFTDQALAPIHANNESGARRLSDPLLV